MSADREFSSQVAISQDFDFADRTICEARVPKRRFIDARTVIELVQVGQIDGHVIGRVAGVVEAALRDSANERHLTTFEPDTNRAARSGGLAFTTATAGFAVAAGFTLTEAFAAMLRTGTRF
jgi:hypothetical protein